MSDEILSRARLLREAFDESFARPASTARDEAMLDLLAITVDATHYALRLDEVSGMAADRKPVPVPSPVPGLLGVVALRGEVTPVYSLAELLGHAGTAAPRWLALCTEGPLHLALAFDALDGHLRAPRTALRDATAQARGHVRAVAEVAGSAYAVISVASLFATIRQQCGLDRTL